MAFCAPVHLSFPTLSKLRPRQLTGLRHGLLVTRQRRASHFWMNTPPTSSPRTDEAAEESVTSSLSANDIPSESNPKRRVEDELTARVRQDLAASGINLDDLLDASSALKLTLEQDELLQQLDTMPSDNPDRAKKEERLAIVQGDLSRVRRQVMQPFLKKVFLFQGIISAIVGGLLASNKIPGLDLPLVAQALGFWTVWLFTIPSLRARKGTARWEKSALNISFVSIPLINVLLPLVTKQCTIIWSADICILLSCYAFYLRKAVNEVDAETEVEQAKIKGILRYIDWGSWR